MDEFDDANVPQQDSMVRQFYQKISDIPNDWVSLEDKLYRIIEMGDLELKECASLSEFQDLTYFNYCQARNGGPIAFLTKEYVLLVGQKTPKNQVFLLDGFGKKYKTLFLDKIIKNLTSHTKWVLMAFTADEDLLLMVNDGRIFIVDIIEGIVLGENYIKLQNGDFSQDNVIEDAKFENNTVVFRTKGYRFHYITNISVQTLGQTAVPLQTSKELQRNVQEARTGEPEQFVIEVNEMGGIKVRVLCTDPKEGIHEITNYKEVIYHTSFPDSGGDMSERIGKAKYLQQNETKKWTAIYTDPDSHGNVIVLMDMTQVARQQTGQLGAMGITVCGGNDNVFILLSLPQSVCIVGPTQNVTVELKSEAAGVYTTAETDGIRICTATKTFFCDLVQRSTQDTFELAGIKPSAKLNHAQKQVDIKSPKAEEIIRDLGSDLNAGIEALLDAAKYEHKDIFVLKHIIKTASFAKKFSDPSLLDPNQYVDLVKHSIVLTAMRNSRIMPRAITYVQFQNFKAKNVVRILLKYRDYKLAIKLAEQLSKRNILSSIYEDWCSQMLQYSKQGEAEIIRLCTIQFQDLAFKMAIDQGFSLQEMQEAKLALAQDDLNMDKTRILQWLEKIKLNIDFTKLAKIAHQKNKKEVSNFLIKREKHIVKKIPFMLEVQEYQEALRIAVEGGDPNNISKVFMEIIKSKRSEAAPHFRNVIELASKVESALRHLRNFAKKRHELFLLREIQEYVSTLKTEKELAWAQLYPGGLTEVAEIMKEAYYQKEYSKRQVLFERARESSERIEKIYKDAFVVNTVNEMLVMHEKQGIKFKEEKANYNIDCSLSACLGFFASKETKEGDNFCSGLKSQLKINDQVYHTMLVRGFAMNQKWASVNAYIAQKEPACPFSYIGEICDEFKNTEASQNAFIKIKKFEDRLMILIEFKYWQAAIDQIFQNKKEEDYLDDLTSQRDLPMWAREDIKRKLQFAESQRK